jgi:myo-inositol 2-dehydrogenase / D-chiro-inositol 1-dehydrogenase
MDLFERSQKTVDAALRQDRIGTPVSVRIVAQATVDHGCIEPLLARAIVAAGGWLRAKPARLLARGSIQSGQLSVQLTYSGGQSALVSAGSPGMTAPFVDVLIAGNRGVLSWESDRSAPVTSATASGDGELSADARDIVRAVRESLTARGPVDPVTGKAIGPASTGPTKGAPAALPPHRAALKTPPTVRAQKPPYGVLLVAGGFTHQEMYAPDFAEDKRCRLIGLVDADDISPRRKKLNAQLAQALDIPLLPSLDEALARTDVHIASVCAEPDRRAPLAIRCAEAGKHVYLDKPLATSMLDADRIVAALRRGQSVHQMFSLVHTDFGSRTKALLDSGTLGELTAIHCDAFFAKGMAGTAKLGQPRVETARPHPKNFETIDSKRELHNVGVYSLVQIAWLLHRPIRSVFATTANYFFEEHQKNDMEDFAQLTLDFDGGLSATTNVGRTGWRSHPMSGLNRMVFVGAKGAACVDAFGARVEVWADEDGWPLPNRHPEDPMGFWVSSMKEAGVTAKRAWVMPADATTDVRYFLDCIEQGRASDVPAELAATALEVILAAYQSAATGQVVALPLERA